MDKLVFVLCILGSSLMVSIGIADAGSQTTWKVRPGDNLEIIATTLEIPQEEVKKLNPGVWQNNLQIDQKLKLPFLTALESKKLQKDLAEKTERIEKLERKNSSLRKELVDAESQLHWHVVWFWGFWICFGILAFIAFGACWIFRETHPRVFEQPHDRSIGDLKESQTRVRSSFAQEEALPAHR